MKSRLLSFLLCGFFLAAFACDSSPKQKPAKERDPSEQGKELKSPSLKDKSGKAGGKVDVNKIPDE